MHILHICSDYSKQKLYKELILAISNLGIKQTVFVPVRTKEEVGKFEIHENSNIEFHYAFILKRFHRIFYYKKIKFIFDYIVKNRLYENITVVHAHFLFSDGGVAYNLKRKFGIPYITAIRNTDVNFFFKYLFYLHGYGRKIITYADKIIFISPSYVEHVNRVCKIDFASKYEIIPNGINNNWFLNENYQKNKSIPLKILYVGDFSRNKNIPRIIDFILRIQSKIDCTLTLVGGGGNEHNEVLKKITFENNKKIFYLGRISNYEELINLYDNHDVFVLLSYYETFGLVCIEAISRGLPIIHTKSQGVDGYFEDNLFSFSCSPKSYEDFYNSLIQISTNYQNRSLEARIAAKEFEWKKIAKRYLDIYQLSINTNEN